MVHLNQLPPYEGVNPVTENYHAVNTCLPTELHFSNDDKRVSGLYGEIWHWL